MYAAVTAGLAESCGSLRAALGSVLDRYQFVGLADAALGLAQGAQHEERVGVAVLALAADRANVQSSRGYSAFAGRCRALDRRGVAHGVHTVDARRSGGRGIDRQISQRICSASDALSLSVFVMGGAWRARREEGEGVSASPASPGHATRPGPIPPYPEGQISEARSVGRGRTMPERAASLDLVDNRQMTVAALREGALTQPALLSDGSQGMVGIQHEVRAS
jgi:hypothetical protein